MVTPRPLRDETPAGASTPRRRQRPARAYGDLDQRAIVEGAMRIVRRAGVEALSMRTLAAELGVSHATPYYYVESKQALLSLLADAVVGSVVVPPPEAGTWKERLRMLEASARSEFAKYPGLLDVIRQGAGSLTGELRGPDGAAGEQRSDPSAPAGPVPESPNSVRLAEAVVDILREAGFDEQTALYAFAAIYTYMLGQFQLDDVLQSRAGERASGDWEPGGLVELAGGLQSNDVFTFGLDALLRGLEGAIGRRSPSTN